MSTFIPSPRTEIVDLSGRKYHFVGPGWVSISPDDDDADTYKTGILLNTIAHRDSNIGELKSALQYAISRLRASEVTLTEYQKFIFDVYGTPDSVRESDVFNERKHLLACIVELECLVERLQTANSSTVVPIQTVNK